MIPSGDVGPAPAPGNEFPPLCSDAILDGIRGDFWKRVFFFGSVDSTNERALAFPASDTFAEGDVIVADFQSRGRGRLGRRWVSPPGRNVYMSAVLKPEIGVREATLLTVAGALAVDAALRKMTGLDVRIKWPNDLMVNGRKIGGILTELRSDSQKISLAVIGIGVNVNSEESDFPEELRGTATSVRNETGRTFSRVGIIREILRELEGRYMMLTAGAGRSLLEAWKGRSSTIGKEVRIVLWGEVLDGIAETIDDEGMLILRLRSGEKRRISSGDVVELR